MTVRRYLGVLEALYYRSAENEADRARMHEQIYQPPAVAAGREAPKVPRSQIEAQIGALTGGRP